MRAGGGHVAAAQALAEAVERQGRAWKLDLVDTDVVLLPADPAYWFFRRSWSEVYNFLLRKGWTYDSSFQIWMGHLLYFLYEPIQVRLLRRCWRALRPELVISVAPHVNRALYRSLKKELPGAEFVTILTDLADYPPHFWIEPQDQHFICGTAKAVEQAEAIAGRVARIWRVSGMLLRGDFYKPPCGDRETERHNFGLDPRKLTGVVTYGAHGSRAMLKIARIVARSELPIQLVFMCGRNASLAASCRTPAFPIHSTWKSSPTICAGSCG